MKKKLSKIKNKTIKQLAREAYTQGKELRITFKPMTSDEYFAAIKLYKLKVTPVLNHAGIIAFWSAGKQSVSSVTGQNFVGQRDFAHGISPEEAVSKLLSGETVFKEDGTPRTKRDRVKDAMVAHDARAMEKKGARVIRPGNVIQTGKTQSRCERLRAAAENLRTFLDDNILKMDRDERFDVAKQIDEIERTANDLEQFAIAFQRLL